MLEVVYEERDGARHSFLCESGECSIGSGGKNDIVLEGGQVAKSHARIANDPSGFRLDDLGSMTGTWVNTERIVSYGPLTPVDQIVIGGYRLWIKDTKANSSLVADEPAEVQQEFKEAPDSPPEKKLEIDNSGNNDPDEELVLDGNLIKWQRQLHDKLIDQMDLRRKDVHSMTDDQLWKESEALITDIIGKYKKDIPASIDINLLKNNVLHEAVGLGPLEELLAEDSVTEIMVNSADEIYVERGGRLQKSACTFSNDQAVLSVIERIITPLGRRIDESSPMVDARLKDGSRVNAIIPPVALKGPSITIRKFSKTRLGIDDLARFGSVNSGMVQFLRVCVEQRRNIIISGGTGSGKTTLLNVLSSLIPEDERIVTVEDAAELQLNQPNLVSLESRPPNLEGRGAITIRDLVVNSLRMRPDRIVVGECRGGEALDMLQAMNTGHDGSLTTAHANSPRDLLSRLEVMVLMAGMDLPITAIREQISSAVDIIVQQTRFPCGTRKVTYVTEVSGSEGGKIQLQDIFVYKQDGIDENGKVRGAFQATNFVPSFYEELKRVGMDLDLTIFKKSQDTF